MTTEKSKTEYLKRYLEDGKKKKKKPKKILSNPLVPKVKILDENIDIKAIKFGGEEIVEEEEEAPVVAEVIDERPEEVKIKEIYEPSKWKRLDSSPNKNGEFHSEDNKYTSSESKKCRRHDSDNDYSPPRKSQNQSSRMRHDSDSDLSPSHKTSIASKERKGRHDSDSDISPPHRNKANSLVKGRHDSDSDISPPRRNRSNSQEKRRHDSDSDLSPPRKVQNIKEHRYKRTKEPTNDKHKKCDSDSDLSPERIRPFQRNIKQEKDSDSDLSPPRERDISRSDKGARSRPTETLSGLKAGLQNATTLRKETQELREREKKHISQLNEELSGRNAETIVRDKKSGKKRNFEGEILEKLEKEKKQTELLQKYAHWGKGIEQSESQQQKLSDDLYESMKPLARYHGDEDLEEQLKAQIHDDDPMAEYIKKKKKKEISSAFPEYKGPPPPPNRFGIKPGYRWDGVDRSNGFERKYFEKMTNSKAVQEEAYLWSVQDM
ncbi:BUD13 homolog [Argiope bruennichi]|uniref:BUD13 homolog n=1 Tax=Argiope bruennichi TaxID=94029 RepID=A0A8T0E7Q4_ARGBR|nr:BUD13 homolog [Argiope bruennichi]KAF8767427.1 BUD13 like protein [Argiope bruennichi]